jgi:hypothetical protein
MGMDLLAAGIGICSFGIFLLVHIITFRWVRPEHLLKSLMACVTAIMVVPVLLMGIFYALKVVDAGIPAWVCAALVALVIQGLLCFFYVLCVFGPYETSVRMRLVREIAKVPSGGVTLADVLQRYNHATIVDIRLQRLTGSGDVLEKDGYYQSRDNKNLFFIFDAIAGVLKKWINR